MALIRTFTHVYRSVAIGSQHKHVGEIFRWLDAVYWQSESLFGVYTHRRQRRHGLSDAS